ncbi:MAG: hypothetical protein J6W27_03585 [Alphaproteobacteria bacterium]|nr:hypothetical protein [Alphaproteobacteria bacterium]
MTDFDQTKVFAIVETPNMRYEIYMLSRMRLQDLVKQHPVVVATVAINGVDENTDKETLIKKAAEIIAAQIEPSEEDQQRMLEFVKSVEAEMALKYTAVEHVDIPMYPPRYRRRYMNMCRARNRWPRVCLYKNRILNRQMRLLQKKDCR